MWPCSANQAHPPWKQHDRQVLQMIHMLVQVPSLDGFCGLISFCSVCNKFPTLLPSSESSCPVSQRFCELPDILFIESCLLSSEWFLVLTPLVFPLLPSAPSSVSLLPWLDFTLTRQLSHSKRNEGLCGVLLLYTYYQQGWKGLKNYHVNQGLSLELLWLISWWV